MIISKAIEILKLDPYISAKASSPDFLDAIKLSIEALNRIQECRQHPFSKTVTPLPGETMPNRGIK